MGSLTAKSRITIGLVCLLVSVLGAAMMIGMVPNRQGAVIEGRGRLCETIAFCSSDYISRGESRRLEFFLENMVQRNSDVMSAAVRRISGDLVTEVGDHAIHWSGASGESSTSTHVRVPILAGQRKWGTVEVVFRPFGKQSVLGFIAGPWVMLIGFVAAASYILFFIYLGKMLQHLDPSKSVPKRVRAALDSLAEGLLVIDREDRIVLANQAFGQWVSRAPEKLIGTKTSLLQWVKDENGEPVKSYPWMDAIKQEKAQAGVMLGLNVRDEPTRVLMANASPVLGHDGKYRGVLVSFDDVTQLEETKKDLDVAKQEAEHANEAKSSFLAQMSHEIRTPMNAILGYTDVLRRGFDENVEDRQDYLNTIHTSGEHLLTLINDILDLSKVESGRMDLEIAPNSPHAIISQVISVLQGKAEEKGIDLEFECDGLLPETILTDSVRLQQTIMNLAGNAIKFTDEGSVRIVARLVGQASSLSDRLEACPTKSQLAIDVIDTGIGISEEGQRKIFDPFSQADSSVTRRFGGTGLGLAISKQLSEALGGGISVTSEPGKGSKFSFTVDTGPLEGVRMIDAKTAKTELKQKAAQKVETKQLRSSRVLVADDGPSNRKLVQLVLGRAGVDVVAVENGKEALDAALAEPFDVILMDMQMPVMDGYTASTKLREAGYERPIIALTAHAMQGAEEKCREAGCSGFLTKPINIDKLLSAIAEVVGIDDRTEAEANKAEAAPSHDDFQKVANDITELADVASKAVAQQADASVPTDAVPTKAVDYQKKDIPPVVCSLPLDDLDFLEIAQEFVERLNEKIAAMREAQDAGNLSELANLAHWLKGSGGTAGFEAFTEPAIELEMAAKSGKTEELAALLDTIAAMIDRIDLPSAPGESENTSPTRERADGVGFRGETSSLARRACVETGNQPQAEPIFSSLPTEDPEFLEIVEEFIERLNKKTADMEAAWHARDLSELASLAHWLKGSGGTAGFDALTEPARQLEQLAKTEQSSEIQPAIANLQELVHRISISPTHSAAL